MTRAEYKKYLTTPHWREVSEETKRLAGHKCQRWHGHDGRLMTRLNNYEAIGHEIPGKDTICLCEQCYAKLHNGTRRTEKIQS